MRGTVKPLVDNYGDSFSGAALPPVQVGFFDTCQYADSALFYK